MVTLKVIKNFNDLVAKVRRLAGEKFEVNNERAKILADHPAKIVEIERIVKEESVSLSEMSYKELQKMAKERGLKSVGVKKEELVNILSK
jgi:hypothetical protein